RLKGIAGVEAASLTTSVPPFGAGTLGVEVEGRPPRKPEEQAPETGTITISPDFFQTVGVQLLRGRVFTDADGAPGAETVIVNEKLAALLFPKEDPMGRRIRFVNQPSNGPQPPGAPAPPAQPWRTIVGICPTLRHTNGQTAEPIAASYVPLRQDPTGFAI